MTNDTQPTPPAVDVAALRQLAEAAARKYPAELEHECADMRSVETAHNAILDQHGQRLADSLNSHVGEIYADYDEDGTWYTDIGTYDLFKFWEQATPAAVLGLLDELAAKEKQEKTCAMHLRATLAKYQSDIDKLAAAIIDHPNVPGGFIETVVAHIWAMRRGIAQLTTQHVITLNRAAEMTGLNLQQVRQWAGSGNMRRDADTQSTDCSLASKLLGLSVVCCATCHHDDDGDLIEIGIRGDSYWVCCAVNAAAFAPQQVNRHNAADQARVRPAAALSAVPEGGDGAK